MKCLLLILLSSILMACAKPESEDDLIRNSDKNYIDTGLVSTTFYSENETIICVGILKSDGTVEMSETSSFDTDDIIRFNDSDELLLVIDSSPENMESNCIEFERGYVDTTKESIPAKSTMYLVEILN